MRVLILRSIVFDDEVKHPLVKMLVDCYKEAGHEVAVYNMPATDNLEHWAGYAIVDYNNWADMLICIDFPTALIQHRKKRVILTKKLPEDTSFLKAIRTVQNESFDFLVYGKSNKGFDEITTNIKEYIKMGEKK